MDTCQRVDMCSYRIVFNSTNHKTKAPSILVYTLGIDFSVKNIEMHATDILNYLSIYLRLSSNPCFHKKKKKGSSPCKNLNTLTILKDEMTPFNDQGKWFWFFWILPYHFGQFQSILAKIKNMNHCLYLYLIWYKGE